MTGRRYSMPSLISNILIFFVAVGILFSINADISEIQNQPPTEGVDMSGLSVAILTLVAVLVMIYGGMVLLNLILKTVHVATDKWGFAIPCLIVDIVILVINVAAAISTINESGVGGIALGVGVVLLSLVSLGSNITSIAKRNE